MFLEKLAKLQLEREQRKAKELEEKRAREEEERQRREEEARKAAEELFYNGDDLLDTAEVQSGLQIRRGKRDNLGIIFLITPLKHML